MKNKKSNTRNLIWILILGTIPLTALPQENLVSDSDLQDTISRVKPVSPHSLYTSAGYGNNMILGSSFSQYQPFYYGSLIYGYNNEFYVSASTFHLSAFEPFLAYHTFSINYSHVFNSWFDISLDASRYQVANELADTLFNSFFYGDITLGVDWKLLYSKLSVIGLLSETSATYFQIRNSRYFQTPEFFNKKAYISFDPYASLLFGSLTQTTTSDGTTTGISSPFHTSGSASTSAGGSGGSGGFGGSGSSGTTSTTKTSIIFGLMEIDFGLPVGFNTGKLTIEAEPGYVLPMHEILGMPSSEGFVFTLTCSFKIF
jgi:hypothetical protein